MLGNTCSAHFASINRLLVRHSSKAAKAQKRATKAKAQRRAEDQRLRTLALDRATQAQGVEAVLSEPTRGGLNERVIYKYTGERLPDIRLVIGAGVTISCMAAVFADYLVRPFPIYDAEGQKVEQEVTWKTYALSGAAIVAGIGCAGYSFFYPSRMVKSLVLLPPLGQLLPAGKLPNDIYNSYQIRIHSMASDAIPRLYKPKTVPFGSVELLGPLSQSSKRYHPNDAFDSRRTRNGKLPSHVPFRLAGQRSTYVLRRDEGKFEHLEDIERALLVNSEPASFP